MASNTQKQDHPPVRLEQVSGMLQGISRDRTKHCSWKSADQHHNSKPNNRCVLVKLTANIRDSEVVESNLLQLENIQGPIDVVLILSVNRTVRSQLLNRMLKLPADYGEEWTNRSDLPGLWMWAEPIRLESQPSMQNVSIVFLHVVGHRIEGWPNSGTNNTVPPFSISGALRSSLARIQRCKLLPLSFILPARLGPRTSDRSFLGPFGCPETLVEEDKLLDESKLKNEFSPITDDQGMLTGSDLAGILRLAQALKKLGTFVGKRVHYVQRSLELPKIRSPIDFITFISLYNSLKKHEAPQIY